MEFNFKLTTVVELNGVIGGSSMPEQGSPYIYSLKAMGEIKEPQMFKFFNAEKVRGGLQ
ncbi:hypothetical protein [Coxiella-like endosymbiont]|uniref:hypothetical protein n=1 Tax=Coxiella-like endosymbiont TaxID=1592897 RepID=UPI00272BA808|nr:hypothetical protein [Coxiella-like endosymbiont]